MIMSSSTCSVATTPIRMQVTSAVFAQGHSPWATMSISLLTACCKNVQTMARREVSYGSIIRVCEKLRSIKAFIKLYQDGCKQLGHSLADIPDEWAPFVTPLASMLTPPTTSHDSALTSTASSKS